MSVDMFVVTLSGEKFPRAIVERAFTPLVDDIEDDGWYLRHPSGQSTAVWVSVEKDELIDGFSINRLPDQEWFPGFWDATFDVMRQTPTVCVAAGGIGDLNWCVAREDVICEQLIEMAEGREHIRLVSSGAELSESI